MKTKAIHEPTEFTGVSIGYFTGFDSKNTGEVETGVKASKGH